MRADPWRAAARGPSVTASTVFPKAREACCSRPACGGVRRREGRDGNARETRRRRRARGERSAQPQRWTGARSPRSSSAEPSCGSSRIATATGCAPSASDQAEPCAETLAQQRATCLKKLPGVGETQRLPLDQGDPRKPFQGRRGRAASRPRGRLSWHAAQGVGSADHQPRMRPRSRSPTPSSVPARAVETAPIELEARLAAPAGRTRPSGRATVLPGTRRRRAPLSGIAQFR